MIEHFINKFMFSITRQCLNQITVAHITGSQTVAMCFHIFYQIREYFLMQICIRSVVTLFICILRHLEEQRKRITALASCTILCSIFMKKTFIKCNHYILCQRSIITSVKVITYHFRSFYQIHDCHVIMRSSHQRNGCIP